MKYIIGSIIMSILLFVVNVGNSQTFEWAKAFGGMNVDFGRAIAVDTDGNVITTGDFAETVDFDPGEGTTNLTAVGNSDIFVQKLDDTGNFLWAKSFGSFSTSIDNVYSITVDESGSIFILGAFRGLADFDPGEGEMVQTASGDYDIFLEKLDADGNFLWVKTFGGSARETGRSICLDTAGNIYISGYFHGNADFDPGEDFVFVPSIGYSDAFVQKLDPEGNFLWVKTFGGSDYDYCQSINLDDAGNIYTYGYFSGTADFDPGEGTLNHTSLGYSDVFVQKLDTNGDFLWAKSFGGTSFDTGYDSKVDAAGNVYSIGTFQETIDIDPGEEIYSMTSSGSSDVFIQKLDADGSFVWAKYFGGDSEDVGYSISLDSSGGIYTVGDFNGLVDFDPGVGVESYSSVGPSDLFVHKLDPSGDFDWVRVIVGQNDKYCVDIELDEDQNIYATGYFEVAADFDPSEEEFELSAELIWDVYVLKWSACFVDTGVSVDGSTISAIADGASYQWLNCDNEFVVIEGEINQTYTATTNGSYAVEINQNGCVETSECIEITSIDVQELVKNEVIRLYPNPVMDSFIVEYDPYLTELGFFIYDHTGRLVQSGTVNGNRTQIPVQDLSEGVYIFQLEDGRATRFIKVSP